MEDFNDQGGEGIRNVGIGRDREGELFDHDDGPWELHLKNVRRQIETNDPDLVELRIGQEDYLPYRDDEWYMDGESVGKNTRIAKLAVTNDDFCPGSTLPPRRFEKAYVEDFFRGASSNRSIQALRFRNVDLFSGKQLFKILVPFFKNNHRFESLTFQECHFRTGCTYSLARALIEFDSLKELVITCSEGEMKKSRQAFQGVIRALRRHSNLESLFLPCHEIGKGGCASLAVLLQNPKSNLARLNLYHTSIDDEGAVLLAIGLSGNSTLKELNLGNNPIYDEGWGALFEFLRSTSCTLEKLLLRFSSINDCTARSLANTLTSNTALKTLDLSSNRNITASGWLSIFSSLQNHSCVLEELNLKDNRLSENETVFLLISLILNRSLKRLDLSYNHELTVAACHTFSAVLQIPDAELQTVIIGHVRITGKSLNCISNALVNNRLMRKLDLSANCIYTTTASWQTFSKVLQSPQSMLENLNLSRNKINDEALASLANALMKNTKLRELSLSHNNSISTAGWESFSPVLRSSNSVLEKLHIRNCSITDGAMISLANSLANNVLLRDLDTCDLNFGVTSRISNDGWAAFGHLLCNESTIMDTYQSNHTLRNLRKDEKEERKDDVPSNLRSLLRLNRRNSRSQAARLKIIKIHFQGGFTAQPFVDMEWTVLPRAISWMGRDGRPDGNINWHFYEFLRSMPLLFDVNRKSKSSKKKRRRKRKRRARMLDRFDFACAPPST